MWLISTIYDAGKISFEGIARKWDKAYINDPHQPPRVTSELLIYVVIMRSQLSIPIFFIGVSVLLQSAAVRL